MRSFLKKDRQVSPGQTMTEGEARVFTTILIVDDSPTEIHVIKGIVETEFRAPWIIATATIAFGLLLGWVDLRAKRERDIDSIGLGQAFFIGLAQRGNKGHVEEIGSRC